MDSNDSHRFEIAEIESPGTLLASLADSCFQDVLDTDASVVSTTTKG